MEILEFTAIILWMVSGYLLLAQVYQVFATSMLASSGKAENLTIAFSTHWLSLLFAVAGTIVWWIAL